MNKQNINPKVEILTKDLMKIQMLQKNDQEGIQRESCKQRAFLCEYRGLKSPEGGHRTTYGVETWAPE